MSNASLQLGGGNFAVKDGKLLGYATDPKTSVFVSREFDFSRGSNLAATRVDANGLIEKGRENLLTYSNTFNQGYPHWATSGVNTPTSGQSGYDGSADAWLLERNADSGYLYAITAQSGVNTFSIYAKEGTANFIVIQEINGYGRVYFNLSNGTIGTSTGGYIFAKSIESVGNGWYRCSVHISSSSLSQIRIYPTTQDGSTSGTSGSIYIQDAQLEQGLVATDYIETTTTTAQAGILEDMPRIDYTNSSSPALLLEPQRTNLVEYSEYINSPHYAKSAGITLTNNYGESPEGVKNSTRVESTDSNQYLLDSFTLPANKTYVATCYVKGTSGERIKQYVDGDGAGVLYEDILLDGTWQRNDLIINTDSDGGTVNLHLLFGYGLTNPARDIETWGWQLEEGSYATSYIPTYGTAVTRGKDDSLSYTNFSDIFGSSPLTQYSIFLDIKDGDNAASTEVLISKGTNTQGRINILGGNRICYYSIATGYTTGSIFTDGSSHKYLLVADNGTIKQYFDGSLISTDTNASDEFAEFSIGGLRSMRISQCIIFRTLLTNTEAIALTTL
jgi:hypothetical protein